MLKKATDSHMYACANDWAMAQLQQFLDTGVIANHCPPGGCIAPPPPTSFSRKDN
jgi:hypothetical protein